MERELQPFIGHSTADETTLFIKYSSVTCIAQLVGRGLRAEIYFHSNRPRRQTPNMSHCFKDTDTLMAYVVDIQ